MITINKNSPPPELIQARKNIANTEEPYESLDTDTKNAIRKSLCVRTRIFVRVLHGAY